MSNFILLMQGLQGLGVWFVSTKS